MVAGSYPTDLQVLRVGVGITSCRDDTYSRFCWIAYANLLSTLQLGRRFGSVSAPDPNCCNVWYTYRIKRCYATWRAEPVEHCVIPNNSYLLTK